MSATTLPYSAPLPPPRLSAALRNVLQATIDDPTKKLTLGLIVETAGESSFGVLMAFLCLPFLTPIPFPVASVPFGLALFILGCQIAIRRNRPWLPHKLMSWRLPQRFGTKLISFVARILHPLERVIHPRLLIMQNPAALVFAGTALAIDGLALAFLPPIPFSNSIPAWLALVKVLGITERDGVTLLIGTCLSFALLIGLIAAALSGYGLVAAKFGLF